jgi:hypothetical protein
MQCKLQLLCLAGDSAQLQLDRAMLVPILLDSAVLIGGGDVRFCSAVVCACWGH